MPLFAKVLSLRRSLRWLCCVLLVAAAPALAVKPNPVKDLWSLKPVVRAEVPSGLTTSANPIDAFVAEQHQARGLKPAGAADKLTLLRRVHFDLTGLAPTPAEQDAFLQDPSPDAYAKVVDRLLASEQHGVRYARHWLDVLRYADADERMVAAPGIYLWRDWVIHALNDDVPYDQFVRAQLTGYRSTVRTQMSATGFRSRIDPRPDDMFALGLLARGEVVRDKNAGELPIAAVDTVSTAFMGLTVGCAKCHDHFYDPVAEVDYYRMKALFDPLVARKVLLAAPQDLFAAGRAVGEVEKRRATVQAAIEELVGPYKKKLYDDRVAMLPDDVRQVILKSEKQRTPAEQKISDDYFPVLRIDADKFLAIMPPEARKKYDDLQRQLNQGGGAGGGGGRRGSNVPAFWTVEMDPARALEKSYVLTSGDPERPEKDNEVQPGWPFAPKEIDFRDGRVEAFSDWLTAPDNPLFARVAVNRIWQWHFGEGIHKLSSDFGGFAGTPTNPKLLDWLAAELVDRGFSMKAMHRLIVTSDTYRMASAVDQDLAAANAAIDPANTDLWQFRLRRLEAEPIWDAILSATGDLDLSVGGPSFDISSSNDGGGGGRRRGGGDGRTNRRGGYILRGFSTSRDLTPNFLQVFDVDDGRVPCPMRNQTVTAPQALFMMNGEQVERASAKFAERLKKESGGDLKAAVELAYRIALARRPSPSETDDALSYLQNDPGRLKQFAWLLFNLDEFVYVR